MWHKGWATARLLAVACLVGLFVPAPAQGTPLFGPPPLLRITGMLLSPAAESGSRYPTLDVSIAGEPRTLYIREVKSLTSDDRGWPILRNLGSFLTLTGPPALIDRLDSEETRGRPLLIEGRLYVRERVLLLTAVESAEARVE
ncbi:MAG: hypothetical protein E6J80_08000 [Deltaproteobacteria bacterium]|nr:MAG: hypothetical protein E6J80_08000 [Deltaproteobacteria bacterium]